MSRASCERQRAALKTATFAAVRAAGGGEAIAAAGLTRVNPPMLSLYAAPHESEGTPSAACLPTPLCPPTPPEKLVLPLFFTCFQ